MKPMFYDVLGRIASEKKPKALNKAVDTIFVSKYNLSICPLTDRCFVRPTRVIRRLGGDGYVINLEVFRYERDV